MGRPFGNIQCKGVGTRPSINLSVSALSDDFALETAEGGRGGESRADLLVFRVDLKVREHNLHFGLAMGNRGNFSRKVLNVWHFFYKFGPCSSVFIFLFFLFFCFFVYYHEAQSGKSKKKEP